MSAILKQSNELKANNLSRAKQLLEQQIAANMKEGIESQTSASMDSILVSTRMDSKGQPIIANVNMHLTTQNRAGMNSTAPTGSTDSTVDDMQAIVPMKPIQPVVITLSAILPETQKSLPQSTAAPSATQAPNQIIMNQVKQYIEQEWHLKSSQILIQ